MQLAKKRALAAKVLKVGKDRIVFVAGHEEEIKEAITRMDILDLHGAGAIQIREKKGRKKIVRRKRRRKTGKIKKKVSERKKNYVIITRKLRGVAKGLFRKGDVDKEKHGEIRRRIRAKKFRSKRHLHEQVKEF